MCKHREDFHALRSLVEDDCVHRDVEKRDESQRYAATARHRVLVL